MLTLNDIAVLDNMAHRLHEFRTQNVMKSQNSYSLGGPDITQDYNGQSFNSVFEQSPEIHMQWLSSEIKQALGKITLRTVFMQALADKLNSYGWINAVVFAHPSDDGQFAYDQRYIQISTKPFQPVSFNTFSFNNLMNGPLPNFGD